MDINVLWRLLMSLPEICLSDTVIEVNTVCSHPCSQTKFIMSLGLFLNMQLSCECSVLFLLICLFINVTYVFSCGPYRGILCNNTVGEAERVIGLSFTLGEMESLSLSGLCLLWTQMFLLLLVASQRDGPRAAQDGLGSLSVKVALLLVFARVFSHSLKPCMLGCLQASFEI